MPIYHGSNPKDQPDHDKLKAQPKPIKVPRDKESEEMLALAASGWRYRDIAKHVDILKVVSKAVDSGDDEFFRNMAKAIRRGVKARDKAEESIFVDWLHVQHGLNFEKTAEEFKRITGEIVEPGALRKRYSRKPKPKG